MTTDLDALQRRPRRRRRRHLAEVRSLAAPV
jgi:hypothetical protein